MFPMKTENTLKKLYTACKIEYHWFRIRRLQRKPASARRDMALGLHRLQAQQLADVYDILAGIRDLHHRVIG